MKYCSLEEAFNDTQYYDDQVGYGYGDGYENKKEEDTEILYENAYSAPEEEINFKGHYSKCPECLKLFKHEADYNIIEHFTSKQNNNIIILLFIFFIIWIITRK